jgi:hypothetical protein
MDSIEQLKENVTYAQQFTNLSETDQSQLLARTEPFGGIKKEFYKYPSENWRTHPTHPLH